jgi:hypothetical protein
MTWTVTITGAASTSDEIRGDVQAAIDSIDGAASGSVSGTDGGGNAFSFALSRTVVDDDGDKDAPGAVIEDDD